MLRKALKKRREIFLIGASSALIVVGAILIWAATLKIPDIASLQERKVEQSTKIYDRTGEVLLDDLSQDVTRTIVPLSEVSKNIVAATLAIEDADFYQHNGIRVSSIIRAVLANLIPGGYTQGGSTITQQVVKNSILTTDQTVTRKIKEWVLSIKLEQVLTKDQILELYLNESPYGGSVYGIEEASQKFVGKSAKEVSLAEAAYLAALPQAPTYYSPYGNHKDALENRKNVVLARMKELGKITDEEFEVAKKEVVTFAPQAVSGVRAPHFVFYVREQLEREYGRRTLEESGWRIITTLDADLEAKAEEVVKKYGEENEKNFNASNAALVAIDPKTGDILAMAGSRDYFNNDIDGAYNIALANRQPGSSFKPFVYAAAFLAGYTPDTVLFDVPIQFSTACPVTDLSSEPPCYSPGNYDDKFRGPMTIRNALAQSINVPAVQALYLVGIQNALRLAKVMGISTLNDPDRYGLTLVLGGGEVTLLDMTSAYSVFANEGVRNPHRAIIKIEDRGGNVVKEYPLSPQQALDPDVALSISDVLSDNVARTPELGAASPLHFPGKHVAAKTGTTNDYRDAWVLGYTPHVVAGAWAGNNDNSPMEKKIAGFIVAPLWHEFMEYAFTKYPDTPFPESRIATSETDKPILRGIWQGDQVAKVDAFSGQPIQPGYQGLTKNRITVNVHSILYWVSKDDPRGPSPREQSVDPQFPRWEWAVRTWASQNGYADGSVILQ
ncbi:PBP1A family penicillin-binding protein [Patescibacteria group bacterium]|nr:PBP1A family penicillin-binding protein [Patescibacteria group bacterium]